MAEQIEHLGRNTKVSPLGERYLEVLIGEYQGRVPHGEKTKIAERLGCSISALSQFDRGYYPAWTKERDRRLRELASFADPLNNVIELQRLYDEAIAYRRKRGQPLSSKDPVDILVEIRKAVQGGSGNAPTIMAQNVNANQTNVFNFENLDDATLSNAIEQVTQRLRDGGLDDLGDIVEGQFDYVGRTEDEPPALRNDAPRLTDGAGETGAIEVEEPSQDAG